MIFGLQIIAIVFSLVMIYFTYLHYRRHELNNLEAFLLLFSWLVAVFIILFPNVMSTFAKQIAISRTFDLAVIGGFIFVIPLVYVSYVKVRRIEKKLEEYTRSEALRESKSGKKQKK